MSTEPEDFRDKFDDGGLASNMSLLDHFAGQAMIVLLKEFFIEKRQLEIEERENRTEEDILRTEDGFFVSYWEDPEEKARDLTREAYFHAFQMIYERDYILTEWESYTKDRKDTEKSRKYRNELWLNEISKRRKKKELAISKNSGN
jgi:hypothetical protein